MLTFAVASFSIFFNTFLVKKLPLVEGIVLVIHVFGFFAVLITLWVLGPVGNAHEVFTTFNDYGGWGNYGLSSLVGILAVMIPLLGADGAVHMSEELRDASAVLPKAMILTTIFNGAMGWIMIITFCMVLGNLDDVISSPTGQPYIAVFYNVTQSYAGASVLSALVIVMAMFCNLSITATASRQLFAFARDQGVPFARWFAYVPPGWDVPMNSIVVSFVVTCLLALINIGSTIALNNITSLSLSAILSVLHHLDWTGLLATTYRPSSVAVEIHTEQAGSAVPQRVLFDVFEHHLRLHLLPRQSKPNARDDELGYPDLRSSDGFCWNLLRCQG